MSRTIQLLVIDPQNDFCDLPATYLAPDSTPSLPVRGAHADLQRVASF
ncbi:MAG: cysteine hydrolase, partial [Proteobacteria bacterium]